MEAALNACAPRSRLAELTSKFYTIIPHDFGRRVPPPIVDQETLQKKFDMLLVRLQFEASVVIMHSIKVLGDIELAQGMQKKDETRVKTEVG